MKGIYIFLADGFEETEALTTIDMLRRGGADVRIVSCTDSKSAVSTHNIHVMADLDFREFLDTAIMEGTTREDFMIFPGGMPGAANLAANEKLMGLMLGHYADGGSVAAICAAPGLILSRLPDIAGKKMTCYDGFGQALEEKGAILSADGSVSDGRIVTGRSAGHTVAFGLRILGHIKGKAAAESVAKSIML